MKTILVTILVLVTFPIYNKKVKHFDDFNLAMEYSKKADHKLMVLFTGHTSSNRDLEDILLEDSEIDSLFTLRKIDVVVLNVDDRFQNNSFLLQKIFYTKTWPVCGIINNDTVLISKKCFLQEDLKEKVKEIVLSID